VQLGEMVVHCQVAASTEVTRARIPHAAVRGGFLVIKYVGSPHALVVPIWES